MALQILRGMRAAAPPGLMPNKVCHNVVLQGLAREGRWQDARKLLVEVAVDRSREMAPPDRQEEEVLDYLSYNTVIGACAAAGELDEASKDFGGEYQLSELPVGAMLGFLSL